MNLINDKWIPIRRKDGTESDVAPWEIGQSTNPVVAICAPRPDFRGALYQFLMGLVQTAYAPKDADEWKDLWDEPPSFEQLRQSFERLAEAFELTNGDGPAFMQDFDPPENNRVAPIGALLVTSPGDNAVKLNRDLFMKRDSVVGLCAGCTASALFTLQTNGVAVGAGYRTGIRGGGPLTTLVRPEEPDSPIWQTVWLNILPTNERFDAVATGPSDVVFPWMGPTRDSHNDQQTFPEDVNELQLYWAMPQRIRLDPKRVEGKCSICGDTGSLFTTFATTNYGISYASTWVHSLSAYRLQHESDGTTSMIAIKGKRGGFSYPDWLSLVIGGHENETVARVVKSFNEHRTFQVPCIGSPRVWCFGYDADNATIRQWHDQSMPILILPSDKRTDFVEAIGMLVNAAQDASRILRNQVKAAWFERPVDAKGDTSLIVASFWSETEAQFYTAAYKLRGAIVAEEDISAILAEWRVVLIKTAEELFDRFALQETDTAKNMRRIANAAKALSNILRNSRTKAIEALREAV